MSYNITVKGELSDGKTVAETSFTFKVVQPQSHFLVTNKPPSISPIYDSYNVSRLVDESHLPIDDKPTKLLIGEVVDREGDNFTSNLTSKTGQDYFTFD